MRVLIAHNYYQSAGGEDAVFEDERRLLREHGHEVSEYVAHNDGVLRRGRIAAGRTAVWSRQGFDDIKQLIARHRPQLVHMHNTFSMISPSAYYACAEMGIPVIQTLHNYRLLCPVATLFRNGGVCEECVGKRLAWPGIVHACYHGSRAQTAAVAGLHMLHSLIGTWSSKINAYIALSEFSRHKFVQAGLPSARVFVKPNFVTDRGMTATADHRDYALYVGRLAPEKGVTTLLRAWRSLPGIRLKIAGDGPQRNLVEHAAAAGSTIEYLGFQEPRAVRELEAGARCLIIPSVWYEAFPLVLAEGFSAGACVVASRLGAIQEHVVENQTGLLFTPGDPGDLARRVRWLWDNPNEAGRMGRNARAEYERKFTPDRSYQMLMTIYQRVMAMNHR